MVLAITPPERDTRRLEVVAAGADDCVSRAVVGREGARACARSPVAAGATDVGRTQGTRGQPRGGPCQRPRWGRTKLLVDPESRALGSGIIRPNAAELIVEIALAIEFGARATDVGLTIHPPIRHLGVLSRRSPRASRPRRPQAALSALSATPHGGVWV